MPDKFLLQNRFGQHYLSVDSDGRVSKDDTHPNLHWMIGWRLSAVEAYCQRRNWQIVPDEEAPL